MEATYNQFINFSKLKRGLLKESKKMPADPLNDINFSNEVCDFFIDLAVADSSDDLAKYGDSLISEGCDLLGSMFTEANALLDYVQNYFNDESILGDPKRLSRRMGELHLKRRRLI